LDEEWRGRLLGAQSSELPDVISEASSSLPMWSELTDERRKGIVKEQAKRMLWPGDADKWASKSNEGIPWGSPRILGHRGAGKTHSS